MKQAKKRGVVRIQPSTLRGWVLFGTVATTAAGSALLITFARLQASLWVWQDGFFLTGDQWFNAARTTVTLVGIIGLGGAAFLAYRKQVSTESTHLLEQSSGLRDRYTTGAEQLGQDSAAIRLAGVYALASLADDWHDFGNGDERQVCIDLLCAYLRTDRPPLKPEPRRVVKPVGRTLAGHPRLHPTSPPSLPMSVDREERHVRTAIINSIRVRTRGNDRWVACDFDLSGAKLQGMNLTDADLGSASLRAANLTDADLRAANLTRADLRAANLTDADLCGANLTEAFMPGADLTEADLTNADLGGANLFNANLTSAHLNGANLGNTSLFGATLTGANLTNTNLSSAHLSSANLTGAKLRNAKLTGAKLTGANLTSTFMVGANLTSANLADANLTRAFLSGANLTGANLKGANLTDAGLRKITYDLSTQWPDDFVPPPSIA